MKKLWPRMLSRKYSLFVQLLASFLVIILLLVSFNFASFLFLKNKINDEIIRYNSLNMQHTTEGYEKHFELLQKTLLGLYQKQDLRIDLDVLRQLPDNNGYNRIVYLQTEIKALITNPYFHLDNVIAYFGRGQFVVEKDGSSNAKDMFAKFYTSPSYTPAFWEQRFSQRDFFHIYPAAPFAESYMNTAKSLGTLIPIVIKSELYSDLYFLALVSSDALFRTFHSSPDSLFCILDAEGRQIYASRTLPEPVDPSLLKAGEDRITHGQYYYFYKQGSQTGLTYVTIVPIQNIMSPLLRLTLILISLLLLTVAVGIAASVLFSIRLNNPVVKIIESIQRLDDETPPATRIQEFQIISETIRRLSDKNASMNYEIDHKNSLLQRYSFINKLKRIHTGSEDLNDEALFGRRPFSLLLLQVRLLPGIYDLEDLVPERATYFIREFVGSFVSIHIKDAITLQLDADQILVLLFDQEGIPDEHLHTLKRILDHDYEFVACTIAITPVYRQSADFAAAYEMALSMIKQRPLGKGTIVMLASQARAECRLTSQQEEELRVRVQSGNPQAMLDWACRQLRSMAADNRSLAEIRLIVERMIDLSWNETMSQDAAPNFPSRTELEYLLEGCLTEEQFADFCKLLFETVASRGQARAEEADPITQFVLRYVEEHLEEDISLDTVADKLNISRGYLSTYFKAKTGVNFSDYLNQMRIRRTKEMLADANLKINDISARVGYQNVNSFIRMFKRYSGMTPGEYRKKIAAGQSGDSDMFYHSAKDPSSS